MSIILFPNISLSQEDWEPIFVENSEIKARIHPRSVKITDTAYLNEDRIIITSWNVKTEELDHPVIEYNLKTSNYPSGYVHSDSSFQLIEGFLNSTINKFIDNPNFEYVNSSLEFIHGYPGKNFKFKNLESNELMESKVYLINSQLVELVTNSRSENWFSKSKSDLLESLTLDHSLQNKKDYGIPIIEKDSYSIKFYRDPELKKMFIDTDEGIVHSIIKVLESDPSTGILVYMSGEIKFSNVIDLDKESREAFYTKSMNGSINSMNGKFIETKKIKYNNIEGVEYFSSLYEGKATSCNRIFYTNETLYTQGVIFTTDEINEKGTSFLNSFEIKGN